MKPYNDRERAEIASNIRAYARAGVVHSYGIKNANLKHCKEAQHEFKRAMDSFEYEWLILMADKIEEQC
jgi:aryl-alcohol dehydrogenase-like predicted oxidoreductase